MATKKKTNIDIEKKLQDRLKVLKKFTNSYPESNYINNGFYTNRNVYIKDNELSNIPNEYKQLGDDFKKILNVKELENKFVNEFRNRKYISKTLTKTEFVKWYKDLKRFSFEQIKIRDGKFMLYDDTGHPKWKIKGESDALKGFYLDFDYKQFLNILYAINELITIDVTFYSSGTYLVAKFISSGTVTIYARGVLLEQSKPLEQKTLM